MGCDIHLYVEKKDAIGQWVSADTWSCDEWSGEEIEGPPTLFTRMDVLYTNRFYSSRNYSLFAILANVRNGMGFAGCDTGDGYRPIAVPRGLPDDMSDTIRAAAEGWGHDGHSHSWFTVRELLEYDWTQCTAIRGWISAPQFLVWNAYRRGNDECPEESCGRVSGVNVSHITIQEMEERVNRIRAGRGAWQSDILAEVEGTMSHTYCQYEVTLPYYKECREFLAETMPRLWQLGPPDDVRIVFFFDN